MNKVTKAVLLIGLLSFTTTGCSSQTFGGFLNKVLGSGSSGSSSGSTTSNGGNLSSNEVISALRQALEIGAKNAGSELSSMNGYLGNQLIKINMPPEAQKVESTLRSIGMGAEVDKAITAMNRAAEEAAKQAVPIFVNAIKGITIQDGMGILKGGNSAATNYLKGRTVQSLTDTYRPVIQKALGKVDATKYWTQVFTVYNQLPTTRNKINTDLVAYVTERALDGLFVTIAEEENKIRQNPQARVTDLLRKVFGN